MARPAFLNPTLRWFLFGMVLANIASTMVFMLLPIYIKELGASVGQVGLVFSIASLVPLFLQILGGWLSDTVGRLRTVALGSAAATLGYFGFVLAPSWQWVLLALGLEYISGALVSPSFGAFIAEQSEEADRGRTFGVSQGIFMIVGVVGPALGGLLAYRVGFRFMLGVAAGLYALASALRVWMACSARFSRPEAGEEAPRLSWAAFFRHLRSMLRLILSGGVLLWVFLTDGVRDIASCLSGDLQPLYLSQVGNLNPEQIGWLSSLFGMAMMLVTVPAGWLSDRCGERRVIAGGFLLQFFGIAVFLLGGTLSTFAAGLSLFGVGVGAMTPAYNALVSKVVPEGLRGMAFGLFWTSLGLISLPAPWIGAQLWERFSPQLPFWITALAVLASILPVWFKFRLPERRPAA